jgi:hypothetical protein
MAEDPLLALSTVEALIRATAEGVSRGVLAACAVDNNEGTPDVPLGSGTQVWDGDTTILDNSGVTTLGKLTGWKKGDQVIEIAQFDNQTDFQAFLTSAFRLSGHSTTSDDPFTRIFALEKDYSADATRRWGLLVGTHDADLSVAEAEEAFYVHTSGSPTWWSITQALTIDGVTTTKKVGFLYRLAEGGSSPARVVDQWFLSNHYAGPATSTVFVTPLGTSTTFTAAVTVVDGDHVGTPTWTVQKIAWHVRPTSAVT